MHRTAHPADANQKGFPNVSMLTRTFVVCATLALTTSVLIPPQAARADGLPSRTSIDVSVRTTDFGIPHIKAKDYASLGYGLGYAYARDNLCLLARAITVARGDGAKFFGTAGFNLPNAVVFKWLSRPANLDRFINAQPKQIQRAIRGYAAGYNRWLAEVGVAQLPSACANQPWVRPITTEDLAALYLRGNARASLAPLAGAVFAAEPPGAAPSAARPVPTALDPWPTQLNFPKIEAQTNLNDRFAGGSNAYGLGSNITANGRGMLLGNPHEPWTGIDRFFQAHLQIPGELDVMGVTQFASPVIVIGFNRDIAWSHTISTSKRFTLFELALDPEDPLAYFVTTQDGRAVRRRIEAIPIEIEVLGAPAPIRRTLYRSHYGLMISAQALNPLGPRWGDDLRPLGGPASVAYSLRDVNEDNVRPIDTWLRVNRARNIFELRAELNETLGLPFVNTVAADSKGNTLYADISAVPNVSNQKLIACRASPVAQLFTASGLVVLDGQSDACNWDEAPDTPQPGILPADALPSLTNRTYVTNSNDSYWLSNPDQPLTGFAPLLRRNVFDELSPRTLRTRVGILQVQDRLTNRDGLGGRRFTLKKLQKIWYDNRNHSAELTLDVVLQVCGSEPLTAWPTSTEETVDATRACEVLSRWDRTDNIDSVGVAVWREFYRRAAQTARFSVAFDPADAVNTPKDLVFDDAARRALGDAIRVLQARNIPIDAPLGQIQFVTDDKQPPAPDGSNVIAMHGGADQNGVFNVVAAPLQQGAYTPVLAGPTYMQTVTWDRRGRVKAEAILGFSQTDDPENPLFADQTRRYAKKQFIRLPFREREIRRQLKSSIRLRDRL
ncbi:MAG: penicillin acylase family protein [Myxococcota bacterium]